jgi:hypothetical protein
MYWLGLNSLRIEFKRFKIMNKENFKYDNYLVSYRDSEQDKWTVSNIDYIDSNGKQKFAPMTLEQALVEESLLEREGRKIKIQYNGEQAE